jgi:hypothetical protein
MSRTRIAGDHQRFVPPAAQLNAATAIIAIIVGIGITMLSWLFFESSGPAIALVCGAVASGCCFWLDRWWRRKTAPPILLLHATGAVLESATARLTIDWNDVHEVRHVDREFESIEVVTRSGTTPFVVVIDHFNGEQAEEIRRKLLGRVA